VLAAGLESAALFLQPGQNLLSARGRQGEAQRVDVPAGTQPYTFPLVLLVNEKTASAAEVVAGALQDHGRARILGDRTYGKALVQSVYPLKDETGLALTTAFYFTPKGRNLQRPLRDFSLPAALQSTGAGGVDPDENVGPEPPTRLRAALEYSAAFPTFATEWLAVHKSEVSRTMQISPALLGDFQLWLSRRNIRPSMGEWTAERQFVERRLKQEILNLALGVEAGDEVEFRADRAVRRAMTLMGLE
jgi:carboxyl-terminal processing protease